jgi:hypothetical protein
MMFRARPGLLSALRNLRFSSEESELMGMMPGIAITGNGII